MTTNVYIDGCVLAVPTKNKEQYISHAKEAATLFKKHGAIEVRECWGSEVPDGEKTSFLKAVQCQEDETVVFSWIMWESKKARDNAWEQIMNDDSMHHEKMPFDGSRLIFAQFTPLF